mmetsp:Transcript_614/g.1206  ORF Transcript_614/g.1206 Transcript_614/m.1206 type:complete len:242 (-) Transcript_614:160-885(-)
MSRTDIGERSQLLREGPVLAPFELGGASGAWRRRCVSRRRCTAASTRAATPSTTPSLAPRSVAGGCGPSPRALAGPSERTPAVSPRPVARVSGCCASQHAALPTAEKHSLRWRSKVQQPMPSHCCWSYPWCSQTASPEPPEPSSPHTDTLQPSSATKASRMEESSLTSTASWHAHAGKHAKNCVNHPHWASGVSEGSSSNTVATHASEAAVPCSVQFPIVKLPGGGVLDASLNPPCARWYG